mgnify:CR=1 FL=1
MRLYLIHSVRRKCSSGSGSGNVLPAGSGTFLNGSESFPKLLIHWIKSTDSLK